MEKFLNDYQERFGFRKNTAWIKAKIETMEGLAMLNGKVRYVRVPTDSGVNFVKYLTYLCDGLRLSRVAECFLGAYGMQIPTGTLERLGLTGGAILVPKAPAFMFEVRS